MNNILSKIDRIVTDIIFPPRCAVCDEVLKFSNAEQLICSKCKPKLRYIEEPQCLKCGKEIDDEEAEYCDDCKNNKRTYQKGYPVFNYVPPVSDSVVAIKYKNRQEYVEFYGKEIAKKYRQEFKYLNVGALIPVPIHKNRMKKRGFNQAEILSEVISKELEIPVRNDILFRTWDTRPQKELNDEEREKNLHTAFSVHTGIEIPESVIIVDDIYTTGATIEACTRVLKKAGVKKVYYTSICIGKV